MSSQIGAQNATQGIYSVLNMHHRETHHNSTIPSVSKRCLSLTSFVVSLLVFCFPAQALELEGISFPDTVEVSGQPLQFNGAGLRSKFFVSVYVGGLYLPTTSSTVNDILSMPGAKRVAMHFIYDEISATKIRDAWLEGFTDNNSEQVMGEIQAKIEAFNELWPTLKAGDTAWVDYLPGKGTQITLNNKILGIVEGEKFNQAVLRIWLGDNPVDSDLKAGMLKTE